MPKLKTKSGAKKRFKVTGTGKVKAKKSHKRHILTAKPTKRKRHGRSSLLLNKTDSVRIKRLLLAE